MDDRGGEMGMTLVPRRAPEVEGWWLGAWMLIVAWAVGFGMGAAMIARMK
jgi:hypothetical protein